MAARTSKPVVKSKLVKPPKVQRKVKRPGKGPAAKPTPQIVRTETAISSPNQSTAITIKCALSSNAIRNMILSLWSKIFSKPWSADSVIDNDVNAIGTSYVYAQSLFAASTAALRPSIDTLPSWLHVIFNLLKPHSPAFRVNTLKYQWNIPYDVDTNCNPIVSMAGRSYHFPIGFPDPAFFSVYNQPITVATPATDAATNGTYFQAMMGLFRDSNIPDTNLVSYGSVTSGLTDPSCFARSFQYLGSSGDTPGCAFGECELETSYLRSWIPTQFCPYNDTDVRVSRSFHMKTGDSSLLMTLPFLPNLRMSDFKNPGPVTYKFIDFEEIYSWVIQWLRASLFQVMNNNASNALVTAPLAMSSQSFRIVLRQALLQIFTEQASVQFMTQRPAANQNDNVFVPLLMNSGTYSSTLFSALRLPQILIENLRMLKTHVVRAPKSKAKAVYVPVIGRWWNDSFEADPDLANGAVWDLEQRNNKIFAIDPALENSIDLIDGFTGAVVINMNSEYYQTAANAINVYFAKLIGAGGELTTCGGDNGPGLSLLHITKYVSTFPINHVQGHPFALMQDHIKLLTRTKSKEKIVITPAPKALRCDRATVTVSPQGGVTNDFVSSISASVALSQEMQLLVTRLITPVIRASVIPPTVQQESEWQIAYGEPYRVDNASGVLSNGSTTSIESNLASAAEAPITATSSGKTSDELTALMTELAMTGKSINWGALLSGAIQIGSTVANVVSTVL